ncbi:Tyrosinase [Beauveria bassiana]|uniref:tyrosinase n=1 Tax=Beauveria bassiana TaxID=176275 RepID=A0A2N6NRW3_BEABA|nr:Tyrosinase [Beauveria bassiana]
MRLQLRASSLFLTLASTVLASSFVSSTEGVAGAIVGALGGVDGRIGDNGPIPLRRSITELAAEAGPQWDLYLQALRAMYDRDSQDPESFFQIAEYNNAGKMNTNGWGGYSTHGQTLVKEAKILAAQYPDNLRSIYQRAAEDLRAPYWDWALEPWLPSVVLPETIEVKAATKTGTVAKKIDNPLYTYRFSKEVMQGKYGEFDTYNRMYRCQNPQDANQKLYSRNYKSWVYDVFSRAKSFSEFATTASKGSSIEAVHNAIHWDAGCGGQFMDSQYSAFEPLFMLHHSNVDRLWAYWQAIYPEASTFNGRYQCLSRFNTLSGTMTSLDSPLQPFRQANGEWHTSRSVNSIKTFGYAYQGLEYWTKSETEMQQGAGELINSLYGPEEKKKKKKKKRPSVSSTSAKPTQTSSKQSVQMSSSKQSIQTTSTESTQTTIKQSSQTTLTQSRQTISSEQSSQSASQQSTPTTIEQSSQTTSIESEKTAIKQSSQTTLTQSTQSISSEQSTQSASEQSSQLASKQSTQSSAQASSQPAPTISSSSSSSSSSSQSTETTSKQSTQVSGTVSTGTSKQQSKETSSVQSTTQSSGTVSTDNQHSMETSSVQSTQSHIEQTSSSVLSSPPQSTATAGNRTSSAWPTAGASKPSSPISSSSRAGNETSVASSAASADALPTTSAQVDAQSDSNATETGDNKRFYAGITVDVAYLPVRPCAIEISIDMWRAGDMAIMQMPERGIVYDSISLSDAISKAGLGDDVSDTEVVSQVMSRLHVALRKADGSSIDVTQISGLRVDIEEAEVVTATSKFELPQMVKFSTQVMLDKPVSGCAAQY